MTSFSGGCLCGRVRYTAAAEPAFTGICHCRDCQRTTGSAFSTELAFPKATVEIAGPLTSYQKKADSGSDITRDFCPTCGSSVTVEITSMPGLVFIAAGTLDNTTSVQPGAELFCASAQAWVKLEGERAKFAAMPPA